MYTESLLNKSVNEISVLKFVGVFFVFLHAQYSGAFFCK